MVAGDEGTRLLLRTLLRLHHVWVDGEAEGCDPAFELLRLHRPTLMVVEVHLAEGNPFTLIADARALLPNLRVILVGSASNPPDFRSHATCRPDVVLLRPFRISEFAKALAPGGL